MKDSINDLVSISREFGADPKWVVAGGGNTSLKVDNVLYVKASGFPLATIDEGGFAKMDRDKLQAIWETEYPSGEDTEAVAERERLVLADMMAARLPGEERRPSVETMLHDLLPWPLVVHMHPTLVNGLTCGVSGPQIAQQLFGDAQEWIPVIDPGYVLAKIIKDAMAERTSRGLSAPDYIFLANHGVFVGGSDAAEVREKYLRLQKTLEARTKRQPDEMPKMAALPGDAAALKSAAAGLFGDDVELAFVSGGELDQYLGSETAAAALTGSITPDHIVYAGPGALYLGNGSLPEEWLEAAKAYKKVWGKLPNMTLINDGAGKKGALVAARGQKALDNAVLLLRNALEVCAYTESFGGPLVLEERFIRFIVDWEVENYRSKLASD